MGTRLVRNIAVLCTVVAVAGCASQRPVVYPDEQAQAAGQAQIDADINTCIALAENSGAEDDASGQVATSTATNAAVGGGTGAVVGAIAGNAGRGALVGAASAGIATLLHQAFASNAPSELHKQFVSRCLSERGYAIVGWK